MSTTDDIRADAADLVTDLGQAIGNLDVINALLRDLHEDVGSARMGHVAAAALQLVFASCLVHTPVRDVPPGAVAFTTKESAHV